MDKNRIYMYPQSSCDSVYNCDNRTMVSNIKTYDRTVLPYSEFRITPLNPDAYLSKYTNQFRAIDSCKTQNLDVVCMNTRFMETGKNTNVVYSSSDPRLFNAMRGSYSVLDTRPLDSTVKLNDVYNQKFKNYGKNYKDYSDIVGGDVMYYVGFERQTPYYAPLFNEKNTMSKVVYQDPMSTSKMEYPKIVKQPVLVSDTNCDNDGYCLSWIRDTQMQRDDILASQMAVRNQQRYECSKM